MIDILQETTDWGKYPVSNGIYHVNGAGQLVAYQAPKGELKTFNKPMKQFSKSRRKFVKLDEVEEQLADDVIDFKGSKKIAGKSTKKDQKKGKSTLINLIGYEKAQSFALQLKKNILSKLKKHGKKANNLINTVEFILERNF